MKTTSNSRKNPNLPKNDSIWVIFNLAPDDKNTAQWFNKRSEARGWKRNQGIYSKLYSKPIKMVKDY